MGLPLIRAAKGITPFSPRQHEVPLQLPRRHSPAQQRQLLPAHEAPHSPQWSSLDVRSVHTSPQHARWPGTCTHALPQSGHGAAPVGTQ